MPAPTVTAVVGNPRRGSRTLSVARKTAEVIASAIGPGGGTADVRIVDLSELGGQVLDLENEAVEEAVAMTLASDVVVAASPTYKATYSGLLKCFFDRVRGPGLVGAVGVPVMVGASPAHQLAVDAHLRPLLVELGASCPTQGLFVQERQIEELDSVLDTWLDSAAPQLFAAIVGSKRG